MELRRETLLNSGADNAMYNIVLLPDGYTELELPQYIKHCWEFVRGLSELPWFSTLQNAINIHALLIPSAQSGAGEGDARDTPFGAHYGEMIEGGVKRLIEINDQRAIQILEQELSQWNAAMVVVNGHQMGGSGGTKRNQSSPNKRVAAAAAVANWLPVAMHELGHSAFGLADEYDSAIPDAPDNIEDYPNVTAEVRRERIKWRRFIEADTPLPTPLDLGFADRMLVGLFEGAFYRTHGVFRPTRICAMSTLSKTIPFCRVCMQRIIDTLRPHFSSRPALACDAHLLSTAYRLSPRLELCNVGNVPVKNIEVRAFEAELDQDKLLKSDVKADKRFKALFKSPHASLQSDERLFVDLQFADLNSSPDYGCLTFYSDAGELDVFLEVWA
ncbi:MAG: M64 family metallopeptidase [Candidatus Alcyoniella australis]|nr:M64 family metallopeptidase [Candidatus Alcyoniella australis]